VSLVLQLKREAITDVADAAGKWQFEGGKVFEEDKLVARYASIKRVVFKATDVQNAAMLTLGIFFLNNQPPENITMEGAHDFASGGEIGSVNAASSTQAAYIGKQFKRVGDTLQIG
jgi:hypothetical protein